MQPFRSYGSVGRTLPVAQQLVVHPTASALQNSSSSLGSTFVSMRGTLIACSTTKCNSVPVTHGSFELFHLVVSYSLDSGAFVLLGRWLGLLTGVQGVLRDASLEHIFVSVGPILRPIHAP